MDADSATIAPEPTASSAATLPAVLVIARNQSLAPRVRLECPTPVEVISATTEADTLRGFAASGLALLVLDASSTPVPMRNLLGLVAEHPGTAWLPLLVLLPPKGGPAEAELFGLGTDLYLRSPVAIGLLGAAVAGRLRKAELLRGAACVDPVSGLPNAAGLELLFGMWSAIAQRDRQKLSVGMIRVEGYDALLARAGLVIADDELREMVQVFASPFCGSDVVARWSPTEFVVLLHESSQGGATRALTDAVQMVATTAAERAPSELALQLHTAAVEASPDEPLAIVVARLRSSMAGGGAVQV